MEYNPATYFIYKGEPKGFEYELLKRYCKENGLDLEIIIAKDLNEMFTKLLNGEVDIAMSNLTVTKERTEIVNFTEEIFLTRQVLVQRKPKNWRAFRAYDLDNLLIRSPLDLAGKKIHIRSGTSFYERLVNLSEEIGGEIYIEEVPGDIQQEQLIKMVSNASIDYTIADENIARLYQSYYDNIDVNTAISFPQKIAWALRKDSPKLLFSINNWLNTFKKKLEFKIIYNNYFKYKNSFINKIDDYNTIVTNGKISPYDKLIKKYSKTLSWDWLLLASLIYQESKFNPNAKSWAGAFGLMQLIPKTALKYGVDSSSSIEENIYAGVKYLKNLDNFWKDSITDKNERIKFVLASYNAGLGHIIDARKLTAKNGKNPNLWKDVSYYLQLKAYPEYFNDPDVKCGYCRGEETCNYVKEILKRYKHYKNIRQLKTNVLLF